LKTYKKIAREIYAIKHNTTNPNN